jgi:hypothetical protein
VVSAGSPPLPAPPPTAEGDRPPRPVRLLLVLLLLPEPRASTAPFIGVFPSNVLRHKGSYEASTPARHQTGGGPDCAMLVPLEIAGEARASLFRSYWTRGFCLAMPVRLSQTGSDRVHVTAPGAKSNKSSQLATVGRIQTQSLGGSNSSEHPRPCFLAALLLWDYSTT